MQFRFSNPSRITSWFALLALAVAGCWPSVVQGSCCRGCLRSSDAANPSMPTCCQLRANDCGSSAENDRCAAQREINCDENGGRCACCDSPIQQPIAVESDGKVSIAAPAANDFPIVYRIAVTKKAIARFEFLSSQDFCARICCWLN